jgi:SOS response regulatory protein OraA/RecX
MEGQDDEADEQARIKILIAKKSKSSRYKNDPLRLAKYLTSQGFSYSDVKEALDLKNEYT